MDTVSTNEGLRAIALSDIKVSTTRSQAERRKRFDKAAIKELADSIKTVGLLSPIVVRAPKMGDTGFELVAGERRFMAAKLAGMATINATVRDLTDEQVLEVQLIENLQRDGLHELAEAEGYEALQQLGHTADEIADKIGKSRAYVYSRLKLLALSKVARKAFYEGSLNASTALLIARIPVESLQAEALKEITQNGYNGMMSARRAQEYIHEHYMTRLGDGGFPTEDSTLVPAAGPCGACPKRTGNQPQLFGDVKGTDVCTDPVCFGAKREAHAARAIASAKETGQQVISGKEAKKVAPYGARSSNLNGFKPLDAKVWEDPKGRTVRQLLGKNYEPTLLQDEETGALIKIAAEADVKKALRDAGVKPSGGSNTQSAAEKKAKAERAFRQALFTKVRESYPPALARADWNNLAIAFVHEMQQDAQKQLFKVWGWEPAKTQYGNGNYDKAAGDHIPKLSAPDLSKFLLDLVLVSDIQVSTWSDAKPQKLFDAAKRFKVNPEQVRRTLNNAAVPKVKAKKKAARKAK